MMVGGSRLQVLLGSNREATQAGPSRLFSQMAGNEKRPYTRPCLSGGPGGRPRGVCSLRGKVLPAVIFGMPALCVKYARKNTSEPAIGMWRHFMAG
jgi:hypothetical protein